MNITEMNAYILYFARFIVGQIIFEKATMKKMCQFEYFISEYVLKQYDGIVKNIIHGV